MLDHINTAEMLHRAARTVVNLAGSVSQTNCAKYIASDLVELTVWHCKQALNPGTQNEAETLLASAAGALREFLNASIEKGDGESSYRDLTSLINDIDNYFIDSISRGDDNHGWTPATDPPDADITVTVFTEMGSVDLAAFDPESGYWASARTGLVVPNVTHWMGLIYPGEELTPTNLQKAAQRALQPTR